MGGAKAVSLTDRSNPCSCLAPYYREWIKVSRQGRKEETTEEKQRGEQDANYRCKSKKN